MAFSFRGKGSKCTMIFQSFPFFDFLNKKIQKNDFLVFFQNFQFRIVFEKSSNFVPETNSIVTLQRESSWPNLD